MLQRLRHLLAALAATAAVATTTVALSAPAHADPATSCSAISVNGSIKPAATSEGSYGLKLDVAGYTPSNCRSHRWVVTVDSSATGPVSVISTGARYALNGATYIDFSENTFGAPSGQGVMTLSIKAQARSALSGLWVNVGETQRYAVGVPNSSFDTAGATQGTASCSTGGPIVGSKGWC